MVGRDCVSEKVSGDRYGFLVGRALGGKTSETVDKESCGETDIRRRGSEVKGEESG